MSCVPVMDDDDEVCANCGKQGSDTIKLKICTACRLVKYCGVDCQRAHRKQHKKACKQRAAELKDEQLYSQGLDRPEGDFCPICTLPIPLPMDKHSGFNACCMKRICHGCTVAAQKRGLLDCAFCRTAILDNDADNLAMVHARVAKKDPEAINFLGEKFVHGQLGLQKDMRKAVELFTEASELGSIKALCNLGIAYHCGEGVQQDTVKAVEVYKKAAMQGNAQSRHNLADWEVRKGNNDRAVRHLLISAKMGDDDSVDNIKRAFEAGFATKDQYAEALKGYQDAVEEMKSYDRDEAKRLGYMGRATGSLRPATASTAANNTIFHSENGRRWVRYLDSTRQNGLETCSTGFLGRIHWAVGGVPLTLCIPVLDQRPFQEWSISGDRRA
ncbi:hypothetical protein THAOC_04176 [Thalassiosira oceanica]|uniref:MYND-type domain-containing protein n=1 Tax=Thalassiosira oceanica TaxID=159749 RepID=K0T5X0_THAOC|nr:hypothetical protein THAOC_04176 [Thalassiosira oceanica]|eukprot:EJK74163.1 hypothetical protein THAOC_04176 [Thalassiosira oceanica]